VDDIAALEEEVAECNRTINRHLTFIDRLIKDKKELHSHSESLVAKLKATEAKYAPPDTSVARANLSNPISCTFLKGSPFATVQSSVFVYL
jgi:hypothetical protein